MVALSITIDAISYHCLVQDLSSAGPRVAAMTTQGTLREEALGGKTTFFSSLIFRSYKDRVTLWRDRRVQFKQDEELKALRRAVLGSSSDGRITHLRCAEQTVQSMGLQRLVRSCYRTPGQQSWDRGRADEEPGVVNVYTRGMVGMEKEGHFLTRGRKTGKTSGRGWS